MPLPLPRLGVNWRRRACQLTLRPHVYLACIALTLPLLAGCSMVRGPEQRAMHVTAYCPCSQCNGKYAGQGAADGSSLRAPQPGLLSGDTLKRPYMAPLRAGLPWLIPPRDGTIAADTRYYPFGTRMHIPGWGWGTVSDRGGDIKGPDRLDICMSTHGQTTRWGRQNVTVEIHRP